MSPEAGKVLMTCILARHVGGLEGSATGRGGRQVVAEGWRGSSLFVRGKKESPLFSRPNWML